MPRCDFDARIMSGFEIIRRVSEAPSSPSLPHPGCIKQKKKKKNVPVWVGLRCDDHRLRRRIKMLPHIISTTWLFVTKDLPQGRGAVLNATKEFFCKSYFRINPNLCPAVEANSWGKQITPTLRSYSIHYPVSDQWKGRQAIPLARPSLTRLNNTLRPLWMHEVAFAFISIQKVPLNYSAII